MIIEELALAMFYHLEEIEDIGGVIRLLVAPN